MNLPRDTLSLLIAIDPVAGNTEGEGGVVPSLYTPGVRCLRMCCEPAPLSDSKSVECSKTIRNVIFIFVSVTSVNAL